MLRQVTWPKYPISKIKDGRRSPFWKWFYRYISAGNHLISMKFDMQMQILVPRTVMWHQNFVNSKWRRPPYWESFWLYLQSVPGYICSMPGDRRRPAWPHHTSATATALVASLSASGIQGGWTCSPVTGWSRACVPHRWLPSTVWCQPTPTPVEF